MTPTPTTSDSQDPPRTREDAGGGSVAEAKWSVSLCDRVRDLDPARWDLLLRPEGDFYMDRRVLAGLERGLAGTARLRYAVVERDGVPVAAAVLSHFRADASLLAEGAERHALRFLRVVCPPLVRLNMLFCGVPVSAGQNHLRFAAEGHVDGAMRALHRTMLDEARREWAKLIVFKEFGPEENARLGALAELGYRRADSLPMNHAPVAPESFEAYLAGLKSRKRSVLKRSRQKFAAAGLTVEHRTGGDDTAALFTPEVHRLYENVLDRAKVRLEHLPTGFFGELARSAGDLARFTFVRKGDRIVAFACSAVDGHEYHQMFVGYDPTLNDECDLYFNLFFEAVDTGFRLRPRELSVGQSADDFKAQKLSCHQSPLYFHVLGVDWLTKLVLKAAFPLFCPPRESNRLAAEAYAKRLAGEVEGTPSED
jgi:predicted N-acyltransferase